ncbi:MAG: SDR family oxidoreductase [Magnetococcales bacterium]|nr:SDR family oxidoreductase [Magnetococcales bacterium]
MSGMDLFRLPGRVIVITGAGGLLGVQHARIVAAAGGYPVLLDLDQARCVASAEQLRADHAVEALGIGCDITDRAQVEAALMQIRQHFGRIDGLINNAAINPKREDMTAAAPGGHWSRFENYPLSSWNQELAVGLTGALFCSQIFGGWMAENGGGVILNIASDLAVIAPDQRLYRCEGVAEAQQPVKPVTYSVVKSGLLGLTRYLATYWAERNVRVNALSPGGVYNGQDAAFVGRLAERIPMGRMARVDEYQGAVLFLLSDASSYINGANLVADGGRTVW